MKKQFITIICIFLVYIAIMAIYTFNDKNYQQKIIDDYHLLTEKCYAKGVEKLVILPSPDIEKIQKLKELNREEKRQLITEIIENDKNAYSFYSQNTKTFFYIDNKNR